MPRVARRADKRAWYKALKAELGSQALALDECLQRGSYLELDAKQVLTPLGLPAPVRATYELPNYGDVPLPWSLDCSELDELTSRNFDFKVLACEAPAGVVPAAVAGKLALAADEDVLIRVHSDLTDDRTYGAQWVLVTPERVVVAPEAGIDGAVEVAIDQLPEPTSTTDQAGFLAAHGIDDLVAEGRQTWTEQATTGDLAAVRGRSRIVEAEALRDPTGLGGFATLEWRVGC